MAYLAVYNLIDKENRDHICELTDSRSTSTLLYNNPKASWVEIFNAKGIVVDACERTRGGRINRMPMECERNTVRGEFAEIHAHLSGKQTKKTVGCIYTYRTYDRYDAVEQSHNNARFLVKRQLSAKEACVDHRCLVYEGVFVDTGESGFVYSHNLLNSTKRENTRVKHTVVKVSKNFHTLSK